MSNSAVAGQLLSFAVYGPRTWNQLQSALRLPKLPLSSFKRQLKTHLPALVCWLQLFQTHTVAWLCYDYYEFGAGYKCPDSTQLTYYAFGHTYFLVVNL